MSSTYTVIFLIFEDPLLKIICLQLHGSEDARKQKDLFPVGKNNLEPYVIQLTDSTFALIRDSQSIFIDTKGNLLVKNAVKWSEIPKAIGKFF